LKGLLTRIFGTGDSVVFAHHETEEKIESEKIESKEETKEQEK
jgi:hypothetical protein